MLGARRCICDLLRAAGLTVRADGCWSLRCGLGSIAAAAAWLRRQVADRMPLRDYSDDDDFYAQGFDREGVVSIWLELAPGKEDSNVDALQDLCGVGYYDLDN